MSKLVARCSTHPMGLGLQAETSNSIIREHIQKNLNSAHDNLNLIIINNPGRAYETAYFFAWVQQVFSRMVWAFAV